jgi:hypothetical protein
MVVRDGYNIRIINIYITSAHFIFRIVIRNKSPLIISNKSALTIEIINTYVDFTDGLFP